MGFHLRVCQLRSVHPCVLALERKRLPTWSEDSREVDYLEQRMGAADEPGYRGCAYDDRRSSDALVRT